MFISNLIKRATLIEKKKIPTLKSADDSNSSIDAKQSKY